MEPSTPPRQQLNRDQILQIHTLRAVGLEYEAIASQLSITKRQIQYACARERPTPKKRKGRPSKLSNAQSEELIQYVTSSRITRRLSYLSLSQQFAYWNVSEYSIRTALRKAGYQRRIARLKPPLSEINRQKRLAWAEEHIDWTKEQWYSIFWTDETWVTGGRHTRTWVTRRKGEEWNETCIVDKIPKKQGWMFWAGFNGKTKGPCLFWEKEWGTIGQQNYSERIVPLIDGWIRMNPKLTLMQDGAPGHTGGNTRTELAERGIRLMYWPPYSPDLNPIETVWNLMKDYIADNYPERLTYDRLREAVREAWEQITEEYLGNLIGKMRDRCQAVMDAQGKHTRF